MADKVVSCVAIVTDKEVSHLGMGARQSGESSGDGCQTKW